MPSLVVSGRVSPPISQKSRRREAWRLLARGFGFADAVLREWRRRSRDRAALAMLDDRMLRDIGISRVDVWQEVDKPFWKR
jgi:uncharacterized protein YjiS (DUF1127 family)